MNATATKRRSSCGAMRCALWLLCAAASSAQQAQPQGGRAEHAPQLPGAPTVAGTALDQVVAVVNGDLVLDSDLNEEERFERLSRDGVTPGQAAETQDRGQLLERLIDRRLILQQIRLQLNTEFEVSDEAVQGEIGELRKTLPRCQPQCATEAGWSGYLAARGFTVPEFQALWRARMEVLAFIEQRFRAGLKVPAEDIAKYYNGTLVPQYKALGLSAPPLSEVSDRIQLLLLEKQVSSLLDEWLKNLRAEGSVVVLHPGEATP